MKALGGAPALHKGCPHSPDPGNDALQLLLAATHSAHYHRRGQRQARSSKHSTARLCTGRHTAAPAVCHVASSPGNLRQQDVQYKRYRQQCAVKADMALAGSTEAGSAIANSPQESAPADAGVLELMEELKQKTNGIAMLARDCPPGNSSSALSDRDCKDASAPGHSNGSSHTPFVCAPEDFQLEPGAVSHVSPSQNNPLDIFRCSGCVRDECQVCSCMLLT